MASCLRRIGLFLLAAALVWGAAFPCLAEEQTLFPGDSGPQVARIKNRLYELGYFTSNQLSDVYNQKTEEQLARFLNKYGLSGSAVTPEIQALLFSPDARDASYMPESDVCAQGPAHYPALPPLAQDGTLLDKSAEPFLYKNEEDGLWYYISATLSVEIKRYYNPVENLKWFETRVRLAPGNRIRTLFSDEKASGARFDYPLNIARNNGAVLAFSDDFFGWRRDAGDIQGIIVREGRVYSDKTRVNRKFPPLDVAASLPDGRLAVFAPDAHTAQEYLDMGVMNTWAFGPILVQNGELLCESFADNSDSPAPRAGMGCRGPNDYLFVTVLGRRKDSEGCSVRWVGQKLLQLGAVNAINLDGGNSVMLVFDGEMLSKVKNVSNQSIRQMVSMIGFTD